MAEITMSILSRFKTFHLALAAAAITVAVVLSSCTHEKPNFIYMPDMVYSPAFKAQKEGSMIPPVKGTVPRDFTPYPFRDIKDPMKTAEIGKQLPNPLRPTAAVLRRGQTMFNIYCIVCHGPNGEGDGHVVPKFPRPPSLQSDKIRNYLDGSIFHVITQGQNLMPSYASQIVPEDRWAIIHYVRALQRSKHPTADDMGEAPGRPRGK